MGTKKIIPSFVVLALLTASFASASGPAPDSAGSRVMAVDSVSGAPLRAGELVVTAQAKRLLVDRGNIRIEMAPYSVGEFTRDGLFRLLRGGAVLESQVERSAASASSVVDFVGTLVLTYDHKERSTSAFVVDGEARVKNPHEDDRTVRLDRGRGATMVLGDVYPSVIRNLAPDQVNDWLKGYSFPVKDRERITAVFRRAPVEVERSLASVREERKLEDYFSAVDEDRPAYYQNKFADPDKVVETQNAQAKVAQSKAIAPEEAAMIALPSTKIDLDMGLPEVFSSHWDALAQVREARKAESPASAAERKPASVLRSRPRAKAGPSGDEVSSAIERLRAVRAGKSPPPRTAERAPASVESPVADPVYDFSENF
ncbi:MAG: hypothetical protein HUU37_02660 [Bdellovibrionales bacterium]|nr:hypothetical protein [Bdellovibrionales bacterium]